MLAPGRHPVTKSPSHPFGRQPPKWSGLPFAGFPRPLPPASGAGGGGKGGGSPRVAVEAPDSLRSRDYVRVLHLLSSGEIFGPTDPDHPLRCLYLDDTPVEASDGTRNFKDLQVYFLPGTVDQSYIPGFQGAESASAVNVQVETATPWTQTISDTTADAVRITLSLPAIYQQDTSNGDISGTSVQVKIQRKNSGGSFTDIIVDTITGKQRSTYKRSYRIPLPAGAGSWDIRVVRVTADSASSALVNDTYVDTYVLLYDGKFSYPHSALCGIDINAEQFSRVPTCAFDLKGLLVRVPSNYDPETREYDGAWDGTFSAPVWTNNPAWIFFDLLTHPRYGLGRFISDAEVDKWTLYAIGQYCDELVDDGDGGEEPRFTCNLVLQTRQEALKVMSDLASVFRGLVYFAAGLIVPTQDAPADVAAQFVRGNVIDGQFLYRGSARRARHTVAVVTWNDLTKLGRLESEYVEDSDAVERFGIRELNLTGFGCTSRGQAHRIGKWALATEQRETDTVVFQASVEVAVVTPGEIIQTSDPVRAGAGMGGRIHSATTSSIVLDRSVVLEPGETYELSVYPPAGGAPVVRPVTTSAGTVSTLAVSPAFDAAPLAQSVWLLKASNLQPETWRVISIAETENPLVYEVTALQHDPTKYAFVEQDLVLDPPPTSLLPSAWNCQAPAVSASFGITGVAATDVITTASAHGLLVGDRVTIPSITGGAGITASSSTPLYVKTTPSGTTLTLSATPGGSTLNFTTDISAGTLAKDLAFELVYRTTQLTFGVDLEVSWGASPDPFVRRYAVLVRKDNGNWESLPDVSAPEIRIPIDTPGTYEVEVIAVNTLGGRSAKLSDSFVVDFDSFVFDIANLHVQTAGPDELAVTGVASTDLLSSTGHGLVAGDMVMFSALTGGAGLSTGQHYTVLTAGLTANDFKLGSGVNADIGGAAVNFTTNLTAASMRKVTFAGREVGLAWDVSPPAGWLGPSVNDPFFSAFVVTVEYKDSAGDWHTIRTEETRDARYIYTPDRMGIDLPPLASESAEFWPPHLFSLYTTSRSWGQWSRVRFGVRVKNRFGDLGTIAYIQPANIKPGTVTNLASDSENGVVTLTWEDPADPDLHLLVIVEEDDPPTFADEIGAVLPGVRSFQISRAAGTARRYRVQAYDWYHQYDGTDAATGVLTH